MPCGFMMDFEASVTDKTRQLSLDDVYHPERKVDFDGAVPKDVVWLDGDYYLQPGTDTDHGARVRVHAATGDAQLLYTVERAAEALAGIEGISRAVADRLVGGNKPTLNHDQSALLVADTSRLILYRFADNSTAMIAEGIDDPTGFAFSPDGQSVSYTRGNNLTVADLATGKERVLTDTGSDTVLNGRLDWVYQEEIFGRGDFKGHWWSPDSKYIVLLQVDETGMDAHTIVDHVATPPTLETTRYPQAGARNPSVKIGLLSVEDPTIEWIDTSCYATEEHLIVRVKWSADSATLTYQVQDRIQTWLDLNIFHLGHREPRTLLREVSPTWVNVAGNPIWCEDGSFLWLSDRTGWRHIYRYTKDAESCTAITAGEWDVLDMHGEAKGWIYFSATEHDPKTIHAYRVRTDGTGRTRLTEGGGTHRPVFSSDCARFAEIASAIDRPPEVFLRSSDGGLLRSLARTTPDFTLDFEWLPAEFMSIPARDGFPLDALRITPPGFDPSRPYPILCHTYGGPGASLVRDSWNPKLYLWHQVIAQQGYVVWVLDNRTASGKGAVSAWPLHRDFGRLELRDHEDSVEWLRAQPWADGERIGIWGWSFGGYLAAYALTHSTSFRMGIAGAPVTDWRFYDSIYTERYMDLPANNPDGYRASSVVEAAESLNGKLLILHGTIDDNVHIDHSLRLMQALQKAGKQHEVMFYPKARHGVEDPRQNHHLRRLMMSFIRNNL